MRTPRLLLSAAMLSLATAAPASAQETEYRAFKLSDGRTLLGVVLESGAEGMTLRVPQGIATVPYALLADIGVSDQASVEGQPALGIAIAPVQAKDLDARAVAARIDGWLADAVALIPHTTTSGPTAWEEALGGGGFELLGCAGKVECLAPLAVKAGRTRLIVPSLSLADGVATITLTGYVAAGGAQIGSGSSIAGADATEHAAGALGAAFRALAYGPEIDVPAAAAARFAPADVAAAEPAAEKAAKKAAEKAAEKAADPTVQPEPTAAETTPAVASTTDEELLRTIALGFAPVPGLNGAVNEDLPAFLTALVGGVGSAWAAIYLIGTKARTPEAFAGPALGSAYGLVVGWNQAAGLIGLAVRRRAAEGTPAAGRIVPPPALTLTPLAGPDGRRGAALLMIGRF